MVNPNFLEQRCFFLQGILVLFLSVCQVRGIYTVQMDNRCGETISMAEDNQMELKFDKELLMENSCTVTISNTANFPNLMFYFDDFDVECRHGHVSVTDEFQIRPSGLDSQICGKEPKRVYTVNGGLKVTYTLLKDRSNEDEFEMVITAFADKEACPSNGHVCSNGRCIDNNLHCNGYDSCGEGADCSSGLNAGALAGIIIGTLLCLLFVVVVAVCCVCCKSQSKRKRMQASPITYSQPMYGYQPQSGYQPQPGSAPYGYQHQPSCPPNPETKPPSGYQSQSGFPPQPMFDHPPRYEEICEANTNDNVAENKASNSALKTDEAHAYSNLGAENDLENESKAKE
ncbi:hypothetical protein MAR_008506 [Mya arenaria]|uniref:CUB domain-containing protein n=1 Tax=Mya arenaria TaxID=6604 RepID=A0ABY7DW55_MYAAR|nr:hypothetical protein MAR_008506 [Mya arenaria]